MSATDWNTEEMKLLLTTISVAVVFVLAIDAYVQRIEEPRLDARFGEEYVKYRRAVPRWIPRWPG